MKAFFLAAIVVACMISCKKDSTPLSTNLFGKWEVKRTYGGFIYPPDSTYKPGNGNIMQFNSDSTYKHYTQGSVTAQGTFHIVKNGFKDNQNSYDEIYFDGDKTDASIIILSNDVLTIKPLIPDISSTDYQKISD